MAKMGDHHHPNSGEAKEMLVRANEYLSTLEYREALELYTRVLYEVSPGHVCALLNRSLTYFALNYPELAAVDAYRAVVAANDMRNITSKSANRRFLTIETYLKAEEECRARKALWTISPYSNISRLPGMYLGSMYIRVRADAPRPAVCRGFELRGMLRLCAALKFCSGGALVEVFSLIDDVIACYRPELHERRQFHVLGNEAMNEVETIRKQERKIMGRYVGSEEEYEAIEDIGLKSMGKTKTAFIQRNSYPWEYPGQPQQHAGTERRRYLEHPLKGVDGNYVLYDNSASIGRAPPVWELRAATDVYQGETALGEKSLLQVTTSSQGQNVDGTAQPPTFYCDSCAALLILPSPFRDKVAIEPDNDSKIASDMCVSPRSDATDDIWLSNREIYADQIGSPESYLPPEFFSPEFGYQPPPPPPPPPPPAMTVKPDFVICTTCNEVPYCSAPCQDESKVYHNHVCAANIERPLHDAIPREDRMSCRSLPPSASRSIYTHPKAQYLYDIIFLRLFAQALEAGTHPLDNPTVRILPSGSHAPHPPFNADHPLARISKGSDMIDASAHCEDPWQTLPWTFMTHVARPIRYLHDYYEGQGIDPLTRLKECDGWMINELMWKIKRATRITEGPRWTKVYDAEGKIAREVRGGEMTTVLGEMKEDVGGEEVWVGTMHPVFSLLAAADEENGEKATVAVVEEGSVLRCVVVGSEPGGDEDVAMEGGDGRREPCVKAGEAFRRSADAETG